MSQFPPNRLDSKLPFAGASDTKAPTHTSQPLNQWQQRLFGDLQNKIRILENEKGLLEQKLRILAESSSELHQINAFNEKKLIEKEKASQEAKTRIEELQESENSLKEEALRNSRAHQEEKRKLERITHELEEDLKETKRKREEQDSRTQELLREIENRKEKERNSQIEVINWRNQLEAKEQEKQVALEKLNEKAEESLKLQEEIKGLKQMGERLQAIIGSKEKLIVHYQSIGSLHNQLQVSFEESRRETMLLKKSLKEKEKTILILEQHLSTLHQEHQIKEEELLRRIEEMKEMQSHEMEEMERVLKEKMEESRANEERARRIQIQSKEVEASSQKGIWMIMESLFGEEVEAEFPKEEARNPKEMVEVIRKRIEMSKKDSELYRKSLEEASIDLKEKKESLEKERKALREVRQEVREYKELNESLFQKVQALSEAIRANEEKRKEEKEKIIMESEATIRHLRTAHETEMGSMEKEMNFLSEELKNSEKVVSEMASEREEERERLQRQSEICELVENQLKESVEKVKDLEVRESLMVYIVAYLLSFLNSLAIRLMLLRAVKEMTAYFSMKYFVLLKGLKEPFSEGEILLSKGRRCFWAAYAACKLMALLKSKKKSQENESFLSLGNFGKEAKVVEESPFKNVLTRTSWSINQDSVEKITELFEKVSAPGQKEISTELDIIGRLLLVCPFIHQQNFGVQRRFVFIHNFARSWHIPEMNFVNDLRLKLKSTEEELLNFGERLTSQKLEEQKNYDLAEMALNEKMTRVAFEAEEKSRELDEMHRVNRSLEEALEEKTRIIQKIQHETSILTRTIQSYEGRMADVNALLKGVQRDIIVKNETIERLEEINNGRLSTRTFGGEQANQLSRVDLWRGKDIRSESGRRVQEEFRGVLDTSQGSLNRRRDFELIPKVKDAF